MQHHGKNQFLEMLWSTSSRVKKLPQKKLLIILISTQCARQQQQQKSGLQRPKTLGARAPQKSRRRRHIAVIAAAAAAAAATALQAPEPGVVGLVWKKNTLAFSYFSALAAFTEQRPRCFCRHSRHIHKGIFYIKGPYNSWAPIWVVFEVSDCLKKLY